MSNPQQPNAAERRLFQLAIIIISTYEKFTTEYHFSPAFMYPIVHTTPTPFVEKIIRNHITTLKCKHFFGKSDPYLTL